MPPSSVPVSSADAAQRLIPGAYERNTITPRQPGAMTGAPYGSPDVQGGPSPISAATIADRQLEGGGGISQRPRAGRAIPIALLILLTAWPAAAAPGAYRAFTLGTSTAEVVAAATGSVPRDVKRLHERPAVLEELAWHPAYKFDAAGRDSVSGIVFSFVDNQLYRMVIDYDRTQTAGLTSEDLIASLSSVYGPRSTLPVRPSAKSADDSLETGTVAARWRQDDTMIVLTRSSYSDGFGLVITSAKLDALARQAQASAVTLDAREAPAREAARAKADAEAKRAADEKTRVTNKGAFHP